MNARELIEILMQYDPEMPVTMEITEPYDDEPTTLNETVTAVTPFNNGEREILILS